MFTLRHDSLMEITGNLLSRIGSRHLPGLCKHQGHFVHAAAP